MKATLVLFSFILCQSFWASAQEEDHHDHFEGHHHDHHRNEFGVGNTMVYFLNEKEFAYGLHVHYMHNFKDTRFSAGAGYERIFDEHGHNTVGVLGNIMPFDGFSITLMPGIGFEDHEPSEIYFALHLEVLYEFEIGDFHIGPTVGFGYEPEDVHFGAGIHIGYGF